MTFRKVEQPDEGKMLEIPKEGFSMAVAPHAQLFKNELAFWRTRKATADRSGDAVTRRVAEEARKALRPVLLGREAIEMMLVRGPYDAELAGDWFRHSILNMAFYRFLRELDESMVYDSGGFSSISSSVEMALDYDYADAERSGAHVRPESVLGLFGVEPPKTGDVYYYEGKR